MQTTDLQEQTANALTQKLLSLREENSRIGQINQELSDKLRDATTYNQALGLDLYRLDQLISEVEDKYRANIEQVRQIHNKTKELKMKTNDYQLYLSTNGATAEVAKKLQII